MNGGACLTPYCVGVVVLIHTPPLGVPRVGLTVTPQAAAVELYGRPFVVKKPSVATEAGPLLEIQIWNAPISAPVKIPFPSPRGELIWRGQARRVRGSGPGNVLFAVKGGVC